MAVPSKDFEKQCVGKIEFTFRKEAKEAIGRMRRKGTNRERNLRVYRCPHCGWFHIGHKRRRR